MSPSGEPQFTEVEVRRLLARAIELEGVRGEHRSLAEARAIAVEAGIEAVAFERAVREFRPQSAPTSVPTRWLQEVVALGSAFALFALGSRIATSLGWSWSARGALDLGAFAAGVWLARRLAARMVARCVAIFGATQAALYVAHLIFGIRSAQGAATQWAVIGAGVLAALVLRGLDRVPPHRAMSERTAETPSEDNRSLPGRMLAAIATRTA